MNDFQDIHDIVRELNAALGPTLVAALSGSKDRRLPFDGRKPTAPSLAQKRQASCNWRTASGLCSLLRTGSRSLVSGLSAGTHI